MHNIMEVLFLTLNFHDHPIFTPELLNQTSCTPELTKPSKLPPLSRIHPGFQPRHPSTWRQWPRQLFPFYPLLSLSLTLFRILHFRKWNALFVFSVCYYNLFYLNQCGLTLFFRRKVSTILFCIWSFYIVTFLNPPPLNCLWNCFDFTIDFNPCMHSICL